MSRRPIFQTTTLPAEEQRQLIIDGTREKLQRIGTKPQNQVLMDMDAKLEVFKKKTSIFEGSASTPSKQPQIKLASKVQNYAAVKGVSAEAPQKGKGNLRVSTMISMEHKGRMIASAASSPTASFLGATAYPSAQLVSARIVNTSRTNSPNPQSLGNNGSFPLENEWTMYYDRRNAHNSAKHASGAAYENNLVELCSVKTVKDFWSYFNQLKAPSNLGMNSNVNVFKAGIKPMWEDPANAEGGKWTIDFAQCPKLVDEAWLNSVMAAIGEGLDDATEVCGLCLSRRSKGDKLSLWIRSKVPTETIHAIGLRWLTILDIFDEKIGLDFRYHSDSMRTGTSFGASGHVKKLQLTFDSLISSRNALHKEARRRLEEGQ